MKHSPVLVVNKHPSIRISLPYLKKKTSEILKILKLKNSSVEITLVDDVFMIPINYKFMKKKGTTDVLSFPQIVSSQFKDFQGEYLGDILISLDQAKRQAEQQGIALAKEVAFLIVHSILHLIGHDHALPLERLKMQRLESLIWGRISKFQTPKLK